MLGSTGTTLPASPINGQEFYYVADATNGIIWHLRYRAASASAHKWEFIGGAPLRAAIATDEAFPEGLWADAVTVGPQLTVPLAGDYNYFMEADLYVNGAGTTLVNAVVGINVVGTIQDGAYSMVTSGGLTSTTARHGALIGRATSDLIKLQYNIPAAAGGSAHVRLRELQLTPVRVG
jgi:hypothetical protein